MATGCQSRHASMLGMLGKESQRHVGHPQKCKCFTCKAHFVHSKSCIKMTAAFVCVFLTVCLALQAYFVCKKAFVG